MSKSLIFLSYLDFPYYSGLSRRIEGLVETLKARNINPIIISPIFRLNSPISHPAKIVRVDLRNIFKFTINSDFVKLMAIIFYTLYSIFTIGRLKRRYRNDLNAIQYESIYSFFPALLAKFLFAVKIIGDDIIFPLKRTILTDVILKFIFRYTDYVIISNPTVFYCLKHIFPKIPFIFLPNGVSKIKVNFSKKDFKRIIFVGSLTYQENIEALKIIIELEKKLRKNKKEYEILIIGGPLKALKSSNLLKDMKEKSERRGKIKFFDFLQSEKYKKFLDSSYIGLLPFFNKTELGGQRIKTLEFLSHGVLTVTTPEGIRGIAGLNTNTHYLKVTNSEELHFIVKDILENPRSYLKIAHRGHKFIVDNYNWSKISIPYLNFICSILG